ncbi:hypothetical protein G6F16_004657 [Rhizopus arrhizus]|nr:hypothetical protein G6F21_004640 [Rhizopus arrhizus]KAG0814885.1 hypothetical protein G6F20_004428 [Rhizopus arrhizus]KAG0838357.1 hypothetical protein G6F19_003176 [Rhizopus arrhizus]KAG0844681.1 hypothetical protein G6F18_001663 [Rhizopus arrhizus]KAG0855493.1 hypothetical protein G6F17_005423 [Rhizopus arrhizus]
MGKKVTYAIGLIRQSPFAQELKEQKSRYETEIELGNEKKAAMIALEISDLLIAQVDEIDPELPLHVQEQDTKQYLLKAVYYCKKAIKMFQKDKENRDTQHDLVSAYYNLCQCHLSLEDFQSAIRYGSVAASYMPKEEQNKHKLQMIYKAIADAYFMKAIDPDESRHDDFLHAFNYYMKERSILETMTLDDVDRDPTVLPQLIRSSKFNLGVVCSKLPHKSELAEGFLKAAVEDAQALKDYANEKKTWWELGNHYRRMHQDHLVKGCQVREMNIIRQHGFAEDEPLCLEERIKFHLEMKEFSECYRLCKRYKEVLGLEHQEYYTNIQKLIKEVEQLTQTYEQKSKNGTHTLENACQKAVLLHELAMIQLDNQMYRVAIKSADEGLYNLNNFKHSTISIIHLYIKLLEVKSESQWQLRENNIETYISISNQTLKFIEKHIKNARLRLEQKITVYKRRIDIHTYYNQEHRVNRFKKILREIEIEHEKLSDVTRNDPMELDNNESRRLNTLGFGDRITPSHKTLLKIETLTIQVNVLLPEPVIIRILCYDLNLTMKWLIDETKKRTWQLYGHEPIISNIRTQDNDVFLNDIIQDVITEPNQEVDAIVTGITLKSALDIYLNACERLNITPSYAIRKLLTNVRHGNIPLKGSLTKEQIPVIQQVLQRINLINELDLSSNFLSDNDVQILLKDCKIPNEINLSNNRITVSTVQLITDIFSDSDLARISLSFNPIGPQIIQEVPKMISHFPNLRALNFEGTCLGKHMQVDESIKDLYKCMIQSDVPYLITLNLSGNHFEKDMLSIWTSLLVYIERLDKLHLSGVSSDTKWNNFALLSTTSLRGLDYSYSAGGILDTNDINELLSTGKRLTELDLSGCALTVQDLIHLCRDIQYCSNFKLLSFQHNTTMSDEGLQRLYQAFKQCKISKLDVSYCGLTSKSAVTLAQWASEGTIKEMTITGNDLFPTEHQFSQFIEMYANSDTKVTLDFAESSFIENKMIPSWMLRKAKQPTTPF